MRELGPVVKLFASPGMIEGGTKVVLDVAAYHPQTATPLRRFTVQWSYGGVGVIKGVASLPQDMQAALSAAFQSGSR